MKSIWSLILVSFQFNVLRIRMRTEIRVGGEIRSHQFTDKQPAKYASLKAGQRTLASRYAKFSQPGIESPGNYKMTDFVRLNDVTIETHHSQFIKLFVHLICHYLSYKKESENLSFYMAAVK
jgi:hypothetical protein